MVRGAQPRLQSWGSSCITTLLQETLDRSTQFAAIGCIITLFIKKHVKNLGVHPNFRGPGPPDPPVVAPMHATVTSGNYNKQIDNSQLTLILTAQASMLQNLSKIVYVPLFFVSTQCRHRAHQDLAQC